MGFWRGEVPVLQVRDTAHWNMRAEVWDGKWPSALTVPRDRVNPCRVHPLVAAPGSLLPSAPSKGSLPLQAPVPLHNPVFPVSPAGLWVLSRPQQACVGRGRVLIWSLQRAACCWTEGKGRLQELVQPPPQPVGVCHLPPALAQKRAKCSSGRTHGLALNSSMKPYPSCFRANLAHGKL